MEWSASNLGLVIGGAGHDPAQHTRCLPGRLRHKSGTRTLDIHLDNIQLQDKIRNSAYRFTYYIYMYSYMQSSVAPGISAWEEYLLRRVGARSSKRLPHVGTQVDMKREN